jgi:proteasome beta subunit
MELDLSDVPLAALQSSSFTDLLSSHAPQLLPGRQLHDVPSEAVRDVPHGTTLIALVYDDGVVLASDRRATAGNMIARRDTDKVFRSDEFSAVAIAGALAMGLDTAKLFQVELEHYEKVEERSLSLLGKANKLGTMIKGNLALAMQGFVMVPLFVGYDLDSGVGRIFSYEPTGGPYEEHGFHSIGSGSILARGALKKLYTENMPAQDAILCCVQALYDAADDDSATGGPDMARRIFPVAVTVTAEGFRRIPEPEMAAYAEQVVTSRLTHPDGPPAPLRS